MEKELLNLILFEIREVKGDMSEVKVRLTNLEDKMVNVEADMSEVKGRLANLENKMVNVEADMSEVKGRLTNLEDKMVNVEADMSEVKGRLANLEDRMSNVEDLAKFNKETSESIRNVVTSHYMEFKKYIKHNDTQHNLYNSKLLQYKKEN